MMITVIIIIIIIIVVESIERCKFLIAHNQLSGPPTIPTHMHTDTCVQPHGSKGHLKHTLCSEHDPTHTLKWDHTYTHWCEEITQLLISGI